MKCLINAYGLVDLVKLTQYSIKNDIKIRIPKGQREKLKAVAAEMGMSMNQMFIRAVEEYIEKNHKSESENETD